MDYITIKQYLIGGNNCMNLFAKKIILLIDIGIQMWIA